MLKTDVQLQLINDETELHIQVDEVDEVEVSDGHVDEQDERDMCMVLVEVQLIIDDEETDETHILELHEHDDTDNIEVTDEIHSVELDELDEEVDVVHENEVSLFGETDERLQLVEHEKTIDVTEWTDEILIIELDDVQVNDEVDINDEVTELDDEVLYDDNID